MYAAVDPQAKLLFNPIDKAGNPSALEPKAVS
jgi:hypothetical protein